MKNESLAADERNSPFYFYFARLSSFSNCTPFNLAGSSASKFNVNKKNTAQ